jgi:hypothetical protein
MAETAQPTPETDEKKSRGLGSYVLRAFVAVMVYVLSSGPVLRFMVYCPRPRRDTVSYCYKIVYRPLDWAYAKTPLSWPLGMYWHMWVPELMGPPDSPFRS